MHERSRPQGDRRLLEVLDAGFERAREAAGERLACRSGCSDCCSGPFPITRLDRLRLREGLERLAAEAPARAETVVARARHAVETLRTGFPGDAASGVLVEDERTLDAFFDRHASLACPALDPESGRCELYAFRPVSCRTYGPPLSFDDRPSPPCPLCFVGAGAQEVERCRWEPDPDGLEKRLLGEVGVTAGDGWETLIAFALAEPS